MEFENEDNLVFAARNKQEDLEVLVCVIKFNLLIIDIMMPVMEGMQLLAEIKLIKASAVSRLLDL